MRRGGAARAACVWTLAAVLWAAGSTARAHGDVHGRIDALTARLAAHPGEAGSLVARGLLYELDDDADRAVRDFEAARAIDPASADVDFYLGRALLRAGQTARAVATLDGYLAANPARADAYIVRARALAVLGRTDDATRDYDRALAQSAQPSPDHYVERAQTLLAGGSRYTERAIAGLREAAERVGPVVSLVEVAVDAEARRGRADAALAWLARLPLALRETPRWRVTAGELHAQAGRAAQARAEWQAGLAAIEALPTRRRSAPAIAAVEQQLREHLARAQSAEAQRVPPAAASGRSGRGARGQRAVIAVAGAAAAIAGAGAAVAYARRRRRGRRGTTG